MRVRVFAAAGLAFVLSLPAPAFADASLTAYEAARTALLAIWAELPLTVRNATLTNGPATGYGNYVQHEGSSYKPGEQIHVYVEVLGYGWKDNGDGTQSELLDADLSLISASGATLATQEKFLSANIKSREKLLETYLTLDATLTSFEPGAYKLQYLLHDRAAGKDTTFEVPITLVGEASSAPESSAPSAASSSEEAPGESPASSASSAAAQ